MPFVPRYSMFVISGRRHLADKVLGTFIYYLFNVGWATIVVSILTARESKCNVIKTHLPIICSENAVHQRLRYFWSVLCWVRPSNHLGVWRVEVDVKVR